jgi:hypothetical protein
MLQEEDQMMFKLRNAYAIDETQGVITKDGAFFSDDYAAGRDGFLFSDGGLLRCECGAGLKWIPGQVWCNACKRRQFQAYLQERQERHEAWQAHNRKWADENPEAYLDWLDESHPFSYSHYFGYQQGA